jgi:hypothetical protein
VKWCLLSPIQSTLMSEFLIILNNSDKEWERLVSILSAKGTVGRTKILYDYNHILTYMKWEDKELLGRMPMPLCRVGVREGQKTFLTCINHKRHGHTWSSRCPADQEF